MLVFFLLVAVSVYAQDNLIKRADSLISNYKFEKALEVLTTGDSLDQDVLLRIGQCQFRLGASRLAIRPYERVLGMDSMNVAALNQLGQLYSRDGDFAKALSSFKKLMIIDSTNSYYCKQAGHMASRMEDKVSARVFYNKALNLNPADAEASLSLGTLLMDIEEYKSADSVVNLALAADRQYKPLLLLKAKSALEQRNYESVVTTVNSLLEKSDTLAIHARLLGVGYFHLADYKQVMTCMNFLLRSRYESEWIYYYMGVASRELGDIPSSITFFRQAAQKSISENTSTYYSQIGQSYEEMGDYNGAIKAYRAAYNYSKEGILLYHLARTYDVYYKDKATALAYYEKYLESDDTIRRAKEYAKKRVQDMGKF